MAIVRKIRFEYYEVVCRLETDPQDQPDRAFDFDLWINIAAQKSLEARTFDYYQERARLDDYRYNDLHRYWILNFTRLRETNIPSKARIDQCAEAIELDDDEYIGEDINILYDGGLSTLMIQRNRHSLSIRGIESYINLVWNSDTEKIFLRPICPLDVQNKVMEAQEYRRIIIRFADLNSNMIDRQEDSTIKDIYDGLGAYSGITAEIKISIGNKKGESLDRETVVDTINQLTNNRDIVSKVEIGMREDEDSKVEVVDLFSDKVHDYIFANLPIRTSLASEYIAELMFDKYNERRAELINTLRVRDND